MTCLYGQRKLHMQICIVALFLSCINGYTDGSPGRIASISDFVKKALSLVFQEISICPIEVIQVLARFVEPRYPAEEDACSFSGLLLPSNKSNAFLKCKAGKDASVSVRDINAIRDTVLKWVSRDSRNSTIQNRRVAQTIVEHFLKTSAENGATNFRIPLGIFPGLPISVNCGTLEEGYCPPGKIFDFFRQKCDKGLVFGNGVRQLISLSKRNTTFLQHAIRAFREFTRFMKAIPDLTLAFLAMAKNPVATAFGLAKVFRSSPDGKVDYVALLEEAARHVEDRVLLNSGKEGTVSAAKHENIRHSTRSGTAKLVPNEMLDFIMECVSS